MLNRWCFHLINVSSLILSILFFFFIFITFISFDAVRSVFFVVFFLSFSFCLIFFVVFYMCILSETRPITVTVKSRKSLQLGWTNVPNQLVNIGYCLRAALPLGSLLLSDCWKRSFVCVCICFCIMRFVVFHHIRSIWMHGIKYRERKKRRQKKYVELTEKSFQSQRRQCLVCTSFRPIVVLFSIRRIRPLSLSICFI